MAVSQQQTDADLLRLMLAGDEEAFTALYRRRQGGIYRFALQMSGSEAVAEDVVQETFMVLMRDGGNFDAGRGSLAAYLYRIARLRRRTRARPLRRRGRGLGGSPARESRDATRPARRPDTRRVGREVAAGGAGTARALPRGRRALRAARDELRRGGRGARVRYRHRVLTSAPRAHDARREAARET